MMEFLQTFFAVRHIHSLSSDHYCIDTVAPSGDHCFTDTVAPSSDHYCIDIVVPSSDHCYTETLPTFCSKKLCKNVNDTVTLLFWIHKYIYFDLALLPQWTSTSFGMDPQLVNNVNVRRKPVK